MSQVTRPPESKKGPDNKSRQSQSSAKSDAQKPQGRPAVASAPKGGPGEKQLDVSQLSKKKIADLADKLAMPVKAAL